MSDDVSIGGTGSESGSDDCDGWEVCVYKGWVLFVGLGVRCKE